MITDQELIDAFNRVEEWAKSDEFAEVVRKTAEVCEAYIKEAAKRAGRALETLTKALADIQEDREEIVEELPLLPSPKRPRPPKKLFPTRKQSHHQQIRPTARSRLRR